MGSANSACITGRSGSVQCAHSEPGFKQGPLLLRHLGRSGWMPVAQCDLRSQPVMQYHTN